MPQQFSIGDQVLLDKDVYHGSTFGSELLKRTKEGIRNIFYVVDILEATYHYTGKKFFKYYISDDLNDHVFGIWISPSELTLFNKVGG